MKIELPENTPTSLRNELERVLEEQDSEVIQFLLSRISKEGPDSDSPISLPGLLSELFRMLFEESRERTRHDLETFAHDVKHFLLLNQEYASRLREVVHGSSSSLLSRLESLTTRMLLETNSILLADRELSGSFRVSPLPVKISEIVEETVLAWRPIFLRSEVDLELHFEKNLPEVPLDPAIFPSVILNLLENALKYSKSGQLVKLEVSCNDAGFVVLDIRDQGIGVPEGEREDIFLKHFRAGNVRDIEGTGLGLYLARLVVEAHQGELSLEETSSEGSCFRVILPSLLVSNSQNVTKLRKV